MLTIFLEILFWKCEESNFVRHSHNSRICVCFFCFVFIFLDSREEQTKNNINLTSYFWAYLLLNDSGHYQKSKPSSPRMKIFQFWGFSKKKKSATCLERISKFAFPKYFRQWSHHRGMCSLSNWLLWMKQVSSVWISDMFL